MSQRKVYIENTRKEIKKGILVCDFVVIVGIIFLFYPGMFGIGVFSICLGIVGFAWYRLRRWWEHG